MENTAISSPKLLVVDDEGVIRDSLKMFFHQKHYSCETAENGEEALSKLKADPRFNLLITDIKMPRLNGLEVLKEIKQLNPYIEVIVLTGYPTVDSAIDALKIGAFDYVAKPFNLLELQSTVDRCLDRQKFNLNHVALGELMSLFQVSRTINATASIEAVLTKILDSALEVTQAKHGSLLLLDPETETLKIKAARGLSEEVIRTTTVSLGEGISGRVAQENKAHVGNIRQDALLCKDPSVQYESKRDSEPTFVSIPIASGAKVLGVINVSDKISGESFTEREEKLLSVLAGQAAVAIQNATLYDQLQHKISDLRHTVAKLNQTQVQLIQSEKLSALGRFSTGVAHEVKNPLAILLGGIEFLQLHQAALDEDSKTALEKMKEATLRANSIILNLLKFARPSELKTENILPRELITEALSLFKYHSPGSGVRIETSFHDDGQFLKVDKNQIQQVLFNLFANATEAMPSGGVLTIRTYEGEHLAAVSAGTKHFCVIEVADTGEGIAQENLVKLFEPFFTTKRDTKGTGLGLSMSKMIVENHKGKLSIESEQARGTTVRIMLPFFAKEGQ